MCPSSALSPTTPELETCTKKQRNESTFGQVKRESAMKHSWEHTHTHTPQHREVKDNSSLSSWNAFNDGRETGTEKQRRWGRGVQEVSFQRSTGMSNRATSVVKSLGCDWHVCKAKQRAHYLIQRAWQGQFFCVRFLGGERGRGTSTLQQEGMSWGGQH
jgi:hypothetical protein